MTTIKSLRRNVTQQQALEEFESGAIRGLLRRARWGPLRSVAEVFVPFHCYSVSIQNGDKRSLRLIAIDAVQGSLDPYGFVAVPTGADWCHVETRNALPAALQHARTTEIALEKTRREIYRVGFFRLRQLRIEADAAPVEFHVPYWIGFYGRATAAHLVVLDAVRRRMEGAKARELFENWLLSSSHACRKEPRTCSDDLHHASSVK
jgi:hypothetical protein